MGAFALLALGVNGIVGVGIFFAPSELAKNATGGASVLVIAGTALALAPVALAFAALGRRFDVDGGPVVFARAAFGEFVSFLVGWVTYVSAVASASAIMAGLAASLAPALGIEGPLALRLARTALVTTLALVCAAGIVISARTWTTLTILKLAPLLALVGAYLARGAPGAATPFDATTISWAPAALTATFTLQGFEIVPVIAGQVRSSSRAVPFATLGSLALAAVLYVGLQSACVAALPELASSKAPLADAAGVHGGPLLKDLVLIGTSISALGIAFGMMVTTPRYLSALAQGGSLAWGLETVNARGVPIRALLVTWVLVTALVQTGTLGQLFALSATAVLLQFVATAASLFGLAWRREHGLTARHAALAIPAAAVGLAFVTGASAREALTAAGAVLLGLALRSVSRRAA